MATRISALLVGVGVTLLVGQVLAAGPGSTLLQLGLIALGPGLLIGLVVGPRRYRIAIGPALLGSAFVMGGVVLITRDPGFNMSLSVIGGALWLGAVVLAIPAVVAPRKAAA